MTGFSFSPDATGTASHRRLSSRLSESTLSFSGMFCVLREFCTCEMRLLTQLITNPRAKIKSGYAQSASHTVRHNS